MATSPFIFGKVANKASFVNREEEKARLANNLLSGINTIVISPRRWGKSSLVRQVASVIAAKNQHVKFCFLDLFSVRSEGEFYELFSREVIKCSSTKVEDWMRTGKEIFKHLIPKFSIGTDPQQDFSVSLDWNEAAKNRDEILNLPEAISRKKKLKIVVCIDEFQNIKRIKESNDIEKLCRSYWQHHHETTYCLYGSKRHMMSDIFNEKSKPFYRFGDIMLLSVIEAEQWQAYIQRMFKKTRKAISAEFALQIAELMKCHPYYVQQLSHIVWQNTAKKVLVNTLQCSLDNLLLWHNAFFQQEIENRSISQINLLAAINSGVTHFTSVDAMQKYRLGTPQNVSKNIWSLEKSDIINKAGHTLTFLDPVFEIWFNKNYLHKTGIPFG